MNNHASGKQHVAISMACRDYESNESKWRIYLASITKMGSATKLSDSLLSRGDMMNKGHYKNVYPCLWAII